MVDTVILWPSKSSFKTPAGTHEVDIPSNVTVYLLCARRYSEGTRDFSPWVPMAPVEVIHPPIRKWRHFGHPSSLRPREPLPPPTKVDPVSMMPVLHGQVANAATDLLARTLKTIWGTSHQWHWWSRDIARQTHSKSPTQEPNAAHRVPAGWWPPTQAPQRTQGGLPAPLPSPGSCRCPSWRAAAR